MWLVFELLHLQRYKFACVYCVAVSTNLWLFEDSFYSGEAKKKKKKVCNKAQISAIAILLMGTYNGLLPACFDGRQHWEPVNKTNRD